MDDVRAIMDSAGSETAVLKGVSEGGPLSMLFAATYPKRTQALVLCGAEVKEETTADWPWGEATRQEFEEYMRIEDVVERWGQGGVLAHIAPSKSDDERLRQLFGRLQVQSASPHDAVAFMRMAFEIDVRHVAPAINTPTLILHRVEDKVCHVENARWLARNIRGSTYVELPGDTHIPWIEGDDIMDEVREFLTGVREPAEPERVLATVLFTDIVGSTERAVEVGDARWRELLQRHDAMVRAELIRHRGREIKTFGDGFLATFDGPARAIRCACAIREHSCGLGLEVRAGIHTGECELIGEDIGGVGVHIGARVAALAEPSEVLVSRTVTDLVAGSGIAFESRGERQLKGIPGEWALFSVP